MLLFRSFAALVLVMSALPSVAVAHHAPYVGIEASWGVESVGANVPHALATAPDGSVYTLQSPGLVTRFDPGGNLLARWGQRPSDPDMSLPQDLAVGASGAVYVTVSDFDTSKVVKFSPDGDLLATWDGTNGTPTFEDPIGVTTDPDGNVYVGSGPTEDRAIIQLTEAGTAVERLGGHAFLHLARDSDGFFYGPLGGLVARLAPTGEFVDFIGFTPMGPEAGHFQSPEGAGGVAVTIDDSIWATDRAGLRVQRFSRDGALLDVCGYVSGPGPFDSPIDAAASGATVYIADGEHIRRIGMATSPAPTCDALPPRLSGVDLLVDGGPKRWFKRSALQFSSSEAAHATLKLQRRVRRHGRRRWHMLDRGREDTQSGENRVELDDAFEDLKPTPKAGRYRIKLQLDDEADNVSRLRTRRFRVE